MAEPIKKFKIGLLCNLDPSLVDICPWTRLLTLELLAETCSLPLYSQ